MREDYVKAVLYIYPKLAAIAEDYGEHIRNRALGSYRRTAEREAEYLAEEILRKGAIENLKEKVDGILKKLSGEERFLLEMRYFGRRKQVSAVGLRPRSERSYYRRQEKLLGKMAAPVCGRGADGGGVFPRIRRLCLDDVRPPPRRRRPGMRGGAQGTGVACGVACGREVCSGRSVRAGTRDGRGKGRLRLTKILPPRGRAEERRGAIRPFRRAVSWAGGE